MPRFFVLSFYNILLPVFFVLAFPAWLLKMWKRGGYGTGLLERFAKFKIAASEEPKDVVYVHAVSVGEVLIAIKLIEAWLQQHPEQKMVLAATTSTGHAVAREKAPEGVRVIYSPLDFRWIVRAVFRRFKPQQIVLIEAEVWPNLLHIACQQGLSVSMVNARLSSRSESRFQKLGFLVRPIFKMVSRVCVQDGDDAGRFRGLGIEEGAIHVTGSIKFDPAGGAVPRKRDRFQAMLDDFDSDNHRSRPVVLLASTHAGEERFLAHALSRQNFASKPLLVVVPRHAERRAEVKSDLQSLGLEVVLRSEGKQPSDPDSACLVIDSTGELRDWTAHADLVVIGKSWLGDGGQNPAEAIIAGVPVVCGPNMGNFEPLVTMLKKVDGIRVLASVDELGPNVSELLQDPAMGAQMSHRAQDVLGDHKNAVDKTIKLLYLKASVRSLNM
ncbi:MAG: hypothetical protein KJO21_01460 [Verrucomicrobiae bacterium]|nr:hypothetical protein [Verrucomicrobiae bacterium]NNJ42202.1 hypothetical protein [Akkermansiaceae bacterium]